MTVLDMTMTWISNATDQQLNDKVDEYSDRDSNMSPRDAEIRIKICNLCQNELARRALVALKVDSHNI